MNYKETLFFVGKCLTISHDEENKAYVSNKIKSDDVDWDAVVKVSTAHYVFPALYLNFRRAELLTYLPKELVSFMEHITSLNRERNEHLLSQVKNLNEFLLKNDITPIFLKGTSFLLQNLYEDIAERMVGDIDFIVPKNQFKKTVSLLKGHGYSTSIKEEHIIFPSIHYPKMTKEGAIGAVEVHRKLILKPKGFLFDYNTLKGSTVSIKGILTPSFSDQITHNCINKQISDRGRYFKSIALRNSYDLFLLSQKAKPKESTLNSGPFSKAFNIYLGISKKIFDSNEIIYSSNKKVESGIKMILFYTKFLVLSRINRFIWSQYFRQKSRIELIVKSFYDKQYRGYLKEKLFRQ